MMCDVFVFLDQHVLGASIAPRCRNFLWMHKVQSLVAPSGRARKDPALQAGELQSVSTDCAELDGLKGLVWQKASCGQDCCIV